MYGILAKNRGMWGMTTLCKKDGKVERYETKEEAQKVADERNARNRINSFTQYFVEKLEK